MEGLPDEIAGYPSMDFNYGEFSAQVPWFFPAAAFLFGAIIGSFLNVCIYRIPAGKSIVRPGSTCACGQPVAPYDNIPILSWFILRGKARCCGRPYSIRYPLVELLTASLFLICWLLFPPTKALCGMVLVSGLICATFIDIDTMEIPDAFSVGLGVVGLVLSLLFPALHGQHHEVPLVANLRAGTIALQGMLIGAGLVLWIALISYMVLKKDGMGMGDVKLVGGMGAFLGWQGTVTAIFGGAAIGMIWYVGVLIWQKVSGKKLKVKPMEEGQEATELGMSVPFAFGPMLAIAGLLHFLFLHRWVAEYFSQLSGLL